MAFKRGVLAWLTRLFASSNAYDSHLGWHSHDVLPIGVTETNVYGHWTLENTIEYQTFFKRQKFVFSGLLLPCTLISVAPIGNTSWLCDPRWESYALEQAERLKSHARAAKVVHSFALNPLYKKTRLRVISVKLDLQD